MLRNKAHRPITNPKVTNDIPANSPVTSYIMDPAEIIAKYGPINPNQRKRYRA